MKFTGDLLSLLVPALHLGANSTQAGLQLRDALGTHTSNVQMMMGTGTITGQQALFTHHHHHYTSNDENENENENRFTSIGDDEDEDDVRRPQAGQATSNVRTQTKLQESDECPNPPILSCSAKAEQTSSCCVVRPGGVLVHAQFWDLDFGVSDSWGIHGLCLSPSHRPDMCNGQFYENCDSGRKYSGAQITEALQNAGQTELLSFMNTYWVSNDESPEDFWAHECATHGTCVSTLEPSCFAGYTITQEVVPYFETVVQLFQQLDTYGALTSAGITPSSSETYKLTDLQDAVSSSLGYVPDFICSKGQLSSVQYYLNAQGPLQDGKFVASHATRKSDCPKSGIRWLPKTIGDE